MTQDEAVSVLLAHLFAGAIGSSSGKAVCYALIAATSTTFSWSVSLEDLDGDPAPISRYLVKIGTESRRISSSEPTALSDTEIAEAIFAATGHHLDSSSRFTDGMLSISYKVIVKEFACISYVVQLRHHGNVSSMDSLTALISKTIDPRILSLPPVYPIPGKAKRQEITGMGRRITGLIPGVTVSSTYPQLPHEAKLVIVRNIALAFEACWQIKLPQPRVIGEPTVDGAGNSKVGPDGHHGLDGPFSSVRQYLQAYIKSSLTALEKQ